MKVISRYVDAVRLGAQLDQKVNGAFNLVPPYEYVTTLPLAAASFVANTGYPQFVVPNDGCTWQIVAVSVRYSTAAAGAATLDVTVDNAGTAPGQGTSALNSVIALNGTANTVANGSVKTAPPTLAAGTVLSILAGVTATTGLVGMVATITLRRLS